MSVLKYYNTGTSSWETAIVGAQGDTGATGATGPQGDVGATGSTGPQGDAGATGIGATGLTGATGDIGSTGISGIDGSTGATGVSGIDGSTGATGVSGIDGSTGATGLTGATGIGATGLTGASGANGADGATGASGANGADGATGASGANGADGATGASGANGADGATGATGPTGNTGATGSGTGTANKIFNGTSYANIASANGNLQIGVNNNTWNFGSDGNLTLPYSAKVAVSESTTDSGALSLNGSSNYLTMPSSSQWILGTTWTIEFWINANAASTGVLQRIIMQYPDTGVLSYIDVNVADGLLGILCTQNNSVFYTEPTPNQWTHVAIVNNNSADTYLYVYYNGVRQTRDSGYGGPANYGSTNAITIGRFPGSDFQYFPGKLSDIRITSGIAVYTGNFTVPTSVLTVTQPAGTNISAIPTTASVVLLMGMLSSGTAFDDSSSYNTTITNVGSTFTTSGPGLVGGIGGGIVLESISANGTPYDWTFGVDGGTIFPQLSVQRGDNPSGTITGQTLLFGDNTQEAIISTADGTVSNENSQRLVINPGQGFDYGEGGDIYLWAGRGGDGSGSGGDIKIRGGQGGANTTGGSGGDGGYIRIEAGDSATTGGTPGYIDINGGINYLGTGGYVDIRGGQGHTIGGDANITGGYGYDDRGGNVNIWGGGSANGQINEGNVNIQTGGKTWTYDPSGNLTLPAGGSIFSEGFTPSGSPGNTISLQPSGSGTTTNQKLLVYPTGSDGDHIHLATGNLYQTELFLGSDNLYVKLGNTGNVVVNSNDGAGNSATWTFDTTGNLNVPGNIVGPSNANFTIYANAGVHEFTFGDDGTFYAPDNVVLGGTSISIGPGANSLTGFADAVLVASSNSDAYIQGVITNVSDIGSSDWVAYGHHGTDAGGWVDLGFTSSGYNDPNFTITKPGSGYVFAHGFDIATQPVVAGDGSLVLATGEQGNVKDIIFGTGGFLEANEFGRISNSNNALELNRAGANITFSGNLVIAGNTSVFGTNAALIQSTEDLPLLSLSSGANAGVSSIWVEDIGNIGSSNIAAVYANPTLGSKIVRIAVGQNGSPGPNLWDFGADGNLTLPANTFSVNYANGTQVPLGATGATGLSGATGPTGPQGVSVTLIGSVANSASLPSPGSAGDGYITIDSGDLWIWNTVTTSWNDVGQIVGPQGATGLGATGATGTAGTNGATGATGTAGTNGATGATGTAGVNGATGATGTIGSTGATGTIGSTGATGTIGSTGATGATGTIGSTGATGATGTIGSTGATGATGAIGSTGATGPVAGSNTQVIFNDANAAGANANFTFNKSTSVLTVTGNIIANNINAGNLLTANYSSAVLTTAAQPNITSTGTLTSLTVTGNINGGNIVSGGVANITGNITGANLIAGSSGAGNVYAGNIIVNGQPTTYGVVTPVIVSNTGPNLSSFSNGTSTSPATTVFTLSIPSAGTWQLESWVRTYSTTGTPLISGGFYTGGTLVTNSETLIWPSPVTTANGAGYLSAVVTTTGAATYTVGLWSSGTGIGLYSDATGRTKATATLLSPSIAVQATATGTVSKNYAKYTRTASQSVSANSVIVCDVSESSSGTAVSVNTSTGQVTLTAGTYRLRGTAGTTVGGAAASFVGYGWYNETTSAWIGEGAQIISPASTNYNISTGGTAEAVITVASSTVVSLRVISATNVSSIGGNQSDFGGTYANPWIDIEQMGATFALNALDTMSTTGNVSVGGNLAVTGNTTVTGGIRKSARLISGATTLTVADASGFIEMSGGPYTVTLPDPTQAANSGIGYRFWQNTVSNITLSTPAGAFYGPSGSSASTKVLAQATTQYWDVWSDGYNWAVFGIKIA
jgi:hypothetical protein